MQFTMKWSWFIIAALLVVVSNGAAAAKEDKTTTTTTESITKKIVDDIITTTLESVVVEKKEKKVEVVDKKVEVVETLKKDVKSVLVSNETEHKFFEVCTGVMQSPWFCTLEKFSTDPRCRFIYELKWTYEKHSGRLRVDLNYRQSDEEKIAFGFVQAHAGVKTSNLTSVGNNGWFVVPKKPIYFADYFLWTGNETDSLANLTVVRKGLVRVSQVVAPEKIKCQGLGFIIYNHVTVPVNETTTTNSTTSAVITTGMKILFDASSKIELCSGSCNLCFNHPEMGVPCGGAKPTFRWYFSEKFGKCVEFMYNGCAGNANNFVTESDCVKQCGSFIVEPSSNATVKVSSEKVPVVESTTLVKEEVEVVKKTESTKVKGE